MTREDAIGRASALAGKLGSGAARDARRDGVVHRTMARPRTSSRLAAGGKPRFAGSLSGEYRAVLVGVRLFKPNETAEARVRFKPDGSPYGFQLKVPEALPGAALDASAARAISRRPALAGRWAIDFAPYRLLEQSGAAIQWPRRSRFRLRARARKLGDGRFRLRLGVSGDRLSRSAHYVYVPEAFKLRFAEMRSDNKDDRQSGVACRRGLVRNRRVHHSAPCYCCAGARCSGRTALVAGAIVAGLNALALHRQRAASGSLRRRRSRCGFSGCSNSGVAMLVFVVWIARLALVFMAAEAFRAAPSPITRSFGAHLVARGRASADRSAAPLAAISLCRSSWR